MAGADMSFGPRGMYEAVSLLDLFPTFLSAAGAPLPQGIDLDGSDLSPLIWGEATGALHEYLFWRTGTNRAVRHHDWKLVQSCFPKHDRCSTWLFDLATDIGEQNDLATQHPDVVEKLMNFLEQARHPMRPQVEPERVNGRAFR